MTLLVCLSPCDESGQRNVVTPLGGQVSTTLLIIYHTDRVLASRSYAASSSHPGGTPVLLPAARPGQAAADPQAPKSRFSGSVIIRRRVRIYPARGQERYGVSLQGLDGRPPRLAPSAFPMRSHEKPLPLKATRRPPSQALLVLALVLRPGEVDGNVDHVIPRVVDADEQEQHRSRGDDEQCRCRMAWEQHRRDEEGSVGDQRQDRMKQPVF